MQIYRTGIYLCILTVFLALIYLMLTFYDRILQMNGDILELENQIILNAYFEFMSGQSSTFYKRSEGIEIFNLNFEKIDIDSLFENTQLLIKIPESVCNPCYDSVYSIIFDKVTNNLNFNAAIIIDIKYLKEYKTYFEGLKLEKSVFGLNSDRVLFGEIDKQPFPYILIKNSNNQFCNMFLINKDSELRLKEYLRLLFLNIK